MHVNEFQEVLMLATDRTQISLRVPASVVARFDRIAEILERDRTWVMLKAFTHYLEHEGNDLLEEAEGIAQLDRGEGTDLEEVLNKADAIIAAAEARHGARAK